MVEVCRSPGALCVRVPWCRLVCAYPPALVGSHPVAAGREPSDEEIWLAETARRVEANARPLFAAVWIWLLALERDEEQPA